MKLYNFYIGCGQVDKKWTNELSTSGPKPKGSGQVDNHFRSPLYGGTELSTSKKAGVCPSTRENEKWTEMRSGQERTKKR